MYDFLTDILLPALLIATPFYIAGAIFRIVKRTKQANREQREQMLQQNHCIIGCQNCNAQQCPNNPNYISKLH